MIDVIFVLLTFFVFSVVRMIDAQVLPVHLTAVGPTTAPASVPAGGIQTLMVDRRGTVYFNRQPVAAEELDQRLAEFARQPDRGRLFLALEAEGATDRGPVLFQLIERVHRAGIRDLGIVGTPAPSTQPGGQSPGTAVPGLSPRS